MLSLASSRKESGNSFLWEGGEDSVEMEVAWGDQARASLNVLFHPQYLQPFSPMFQQLFQGAELK